MKQQLLLRNLPDNFVQRHIHRVLVVLDLRRRLIRHARGMRQQVAYRDRMLRHAQPVFIRPVVGHHPLPLELRQIHLHRIAQRELAFIRQHHDPNRRHRLGHRHDLKNRVLGHGPPSFDVRHPLGVELHHAMVARHQRHRTRNCFCIHKMFHTRRNLTGNLFSPVRLRSGLPQSIGGPSNRPHKHKPTNSSSHLEPSDCHQPTPSPRTAHIPRALDHTPRRPNALDALQ